MTLTNAFLWKLNVLRGLWWEIIHFSIVYYKTAYAQIFIFIFYKIRNRKNNLFIKNMLRQDDNKRKPIYFIAIITAEKNSFPKYIFELSSAYSFLFLFFYCPLHTAVPGWNLFYRTMTIYLENCLSKSTLLLMNTLYTKHINSWDFGNFTFWFNKLQKLIKNKKNK